MQEQSPFLPSEDPRVIRAWIPASHNHFLSGDMRGNRFRAEPLDKEGQTGVGMWVVLTRVYGTRRDQGLEKEIHLSDPAA